MLHNAPVPNVIYHNYLYIFQCSKKRSPRTWLKQLARQVLMVTHWASEMSAELWARAPGTPSPSTTAKAATARRTEEHILADTLGTNFVVIGRYCGDLYSVWEESRDWWSFGGGRWVYKAEEGRACLSCPQGWGLPRRLVVPGRQGVHAEWPRWVHVAGVWVRLQRSGSPESHWSPWGVENTLSQRSHTAPGATSRYHRPLLRHRRLVAMDTHEAVNCNGDKGKVLIAMMTH